MADITTIPQTQRACVLTAVGGDVKLIDTHPVPQRDELLPGQCLVKVEYTGVCHTDLMIKSNATSNKSRPGLIGGHEGIGRVVAIAEHTVGSTVNVGDRVGIKFLGQACLNCEMCRKGWEGHCMLMETTGNSIDGTFSEYAVTYIHTVTPIPDAIESAPAAAIMCAGFTVYSALRQSCTHVGDWVVIPGAGGGLGHLAIQYAVAMGLRVVAIDTGDEKRKLTLELGAEKWIDFKQSSDLVADVVAATDGGAHAAIVTAGTSGAYELAALYLRRKGYLMVVGLPPSAVLGIPILLVAVKGLTIRGISMGNRQDALEAVQIAASGKVKCQYTIRGLSELPEVYEELEHGKIVGRVVLDIAK